MVQSKTKTKTFQVKVQATTQLLVIGLSGMSRDCYQGNSQSERELKGL